jgi:TRAP-type mannitol/chloroaromatic compound transport system substrate-binding protein
MDTVGYNAWFNSGNGLKLWEELYAKFNLLPRPLGTTSYQMGGWFNKKVNTVDDLKGMKLRFPGLAGKIYAKLGASVVLLPGSEVYTSMERGVIDATDWVGPHLDKRMGLARVAKFYYYPGWQEPTGYTEVVFNKKAHEELPADLKAILDAAAAEVTSWMVGEFDYKNALDLAELEKDPSTQVVAFPQEVLDVFKKVSAEVLEEEADKDVLARKIHDDYKAFMAQWKVWTDAANTMYYKGVL